jgi:hypothetical protein
MSVEAGPQAPRLGILMLAPAFPQLPLPYSKGASPKLECAVPLQAQTRWSWVEQILPYKPTEDWSDWLSSHEWIVVGAS